MTTTGKSKFENINDFLKVILWPIIVLIVIAIYHKDVSRMFQSSSKVSIGSFTMEMQKEAQSQGSGELSGIIEKLSTPGIKRLLSMGNFGRFGLVGRNSGIGGKEEGYSLSPDIFNWSELIDAGLVQGDGFSIDDIISEFKNLKAEETIMYYDDEGNSSTIKDSKYPKKGAEYYIPLSRLTNDNRMKLESYSVELTENGKKALNIIVETTARQIKK